MGIIAREDRRQPLAECKGNDAAVVSGNERISNNIKRVNLRFERLKGWGDIFRTPDFEWRDFEAKRASCGLNLSQFLFGSRIANIGHDGQSAATGQNLAQ